MSLVADWRKQETHDKPCDAFVHLCNGVADSLKHEPPDMCYHHGIYVKGFGINRRGTPKVGSAWARPFWMGRD